MPYECDVEARTTSGKRSGRERISRVMNRYLKQAWSDLHQQPWPEGMYACHTCDDPRFRNPHHIFPGTAAENTHDAQRKGRLDGYFYDLQGSKHPHAKLSEEIVHELRIRAKAGETHKMLAAEYGVAQSQVTRAINGTRWKHVAGGD